MKLWEGKFIRDKWFSYKSDGRGNWRRHFLSAKSYDVLEFMWVNIKQQNNELGKVDTISYLEWRQRPDNFHQNEELLPIPNFIFKIHKKFPQKSH